MSANFNSIDRWLFNSTLSRLDQHTREEQCQIAYSFREKRIFLAISLLQFVLGGGTLCVIVALVRDRRIHKLWALIGLDLKIISGLALFTFFVNALDIFTIFAIKSVMLILNLPECSYIWNGQLCFGAYAAIIEFGTTAFGLIHMSLFFERVYVACLNPKSKCDGLFGFTCAGVVLTLSILPLFFNKPADYMPDRLYCATVYVRSNNNVTSMVFKFLIIDCVFTLGDFLLLLYNRNQIKIYKKKFSSSFSLNRSFALRQMQLSISVIYPFSLVHSVVFSLQMIILVSVYDAIHSGSLEMEMFLFEVINLLRATGFFILMTFLLVHAKFHGAKLGGRRVCVRNETEIYFQQFRDIIA